MVSLLYKHHLIVADAHFEECNKSWRPIATVSWNSDAAVAWEILRDPDRFFETIRGAEQFGIQMARAWVDQHGLVNVTSRS